jgi:hypothetical protein
LQRCIYVFYMHFHGLATYNGELKRYLHTHKVYILADDAV